MAIKYIKAKKKKKKEKLINKKNNNKQENSKYRLCDDRDETINHIIRECRKLEQREFKN